MFGLGFWDFRALEEEKRRLKSLEEGKTKIEEILRLLSISNDNFTSTY